MTSQLPAALEPLSAGRADDASTISTLILEHASLRPENAAIAAAGLPAYTYAELLHHIGRTGVALREAGLSHSSRIAILLPHGPELAVTIVGVASHATAVPCNPNMTEAQLRQLHERINLAAFVLPGWIEDPPWIGSFGGEISVLHIAKARDCISQAVIVDHGDGEFQSDAGSEDAALILQTSGTIGPPKLVPVSHGNLAAMASRIQHFLELSPDDRCACLLPLFYAQGIKSSCIAPLLLGASIALPQAPVLENLETWLTELKPTWFPAGPTFLQAVLDRVSGQANALQHHLRFITAGSAMLPERVRVGIERAMGIPVLDAWGMTEVGLMTANSIRPNERRPGTVGYASPDEVAIAGLDGSFRSTGEAGEVVVRGPAVFSGYIGDDELNRMSFADGWFHTGDLGSIDADGYLTIKGRIREIINRGGEKISPDMVERVVREHPAVLEAAVFAIPHVRLGEDVAAAVVLQSGAKLSGTELQSFLAVNLPHAAVPRKISFLDALPKGTSGKVLRRELAALCKSSGERVVVPPEGELETKLVALWQSLLEREDIGVEDDFFESGGDSLLEARMLIEAEKITQQQLRGRSLPIPATVRAFARGIEEIPSAAPITPSIAAPGGAPFFYCHGDYIFGGHYAYKLAELVGADHVFYLIDGYDANNRRGVRTIEELARRYVKPVLATKPTGLLRLGGHCNGGLLALELARQLSTMGREVEVVVLIEPISLNARPVFRCAARVLDVLLAVVPGRNVRLSLRAAAMNYCWRSFRWTCERLGLNSPSEDDPATSAHELREAKKFFQKLMANYTPSWIPAPIVCLTAEGSSRAVEFDWKPWQRLSPSVMAKVIPGTHMSCLTTHVTSLAESLKTALASDKKERYAV